jgi:protein TonB
MSADKVASPRSDWRHGMSSKVPLIPDWRSETLPYRKALLGALLAEGLIAVCASALLAQPIVHPIREEAILISLDDPPPVPPKPAPKREIKLPPKPVQPPPAVIPPLPQPVERPLPNVPKAAAEPAPIQASEASPIVEVPPPPPPRPPVASNAALEAEFAARLRAAIQAAVVYPPAARFMGLKGRARVEFIYRDGSPRQQRILQSSGNGMIDQAALAAVSGAVFPPAPEFMRGKDYLYQIAVNFDVTTAR